MPVYTTENSHHIVEQAFRKKEPMFITGKAGTGKTTLLKWLFDKFKDYYAIAIVAPTGVAAKNAGGVTIHSLLRLPTTPYMPGMRIPKLYAIRNVDEINTIREIDVLIIDEVSMVRSDLLDAMDDVLRHYRKSDKPFGGVQVIMFGDLYQLMPVIKDEEWEELKKHYKSPYFFSSDVYQRLHCKVIELTKIYRQQDSDFITLLNHVRDGFLLPPDKKDLESRYRKDFEPNDDEGYIRLTTHNWMAKSYNNRRLDSISGDLYEYKAYIEGFYPSQDYPTSYVISLKRGARVMFVRNDNINKQYVNGTLGTVTRLGNKEIEVRTDEGKLVKVIRQTWDFERYKFNKVTKELEIEHCGSFKQYPLRLAWCVTVHKSQGLTFSKVIIDVGRAFTYGQVYVALSRCRYFHGIVLVSEVKDKNIKVDPEVKRFLETTQKIVIEDSPKNTTNDTFIETMSSTMKRTYWAAKEGLDVMQICQSTGEKPEIVYGHLTKLIANKLVDVHQLLPESTIDTIKTAAIRKGKGATLAEIRQELDKLYLYGEINMVKACLTDKDYTTEKSIQDKKVIIPRQLIFAQQLDIRSGEESSRHNKRWTVKEIERLHFEYEMRRDLNTMAKDLHRTPIAILSKLQAEGLIFWDKDSNLYLRTK